MINIDPALPVQPRGAFEGQEYTPSNGTGGQFVSHFRFVPDYADISGKLTQASDVLLGWQHHALAAQQLENALRNSGRLK